MRVSTVLVFVPMTLVAAAIAVANRADVSFVLDPFSDAHPALALVMPLYLLLFFTFFIGMIVGIVVTALRRKGPRKKAMQAKDVGTALVALDAKQTGGDSVGE